ELQQRLAAELDVAPAAETSTLYDHIRQDIALPSSLPGAALQKVEHARRLSRQELEPFERLSEKPGPQNGEHPTHNLPSPATPFIGRERELDQVQSLLETSDHHLLTLLGPGGIGKSRLALAAARRLLEQNSFPDGIWFVPLAGLDNPGQIVSAISTELPFDPSGSSELLPQLLDFLRDKKTLLLLDNMEQLLGGAPLPALQEILATAPQVTIMATSRTQLHLQGEQLLPLYGLDLPDNAPNIVDEEVGNWGRQYDALHLFEVSARRMRPDFMLNGDNITPVLRIARRVEGFPLAIEMAAAWIELLSPAEIDEQLHESFDLLEADWPTDLGRHHSARAVFEWSWRLLDETERALCVALSVFRSGFSREAGIAVGRASLRSLLQLSRKSWLQQGKDGRFHIHELLRQYAHQKLSEDKALRREIETRHALYFAALFGRLGRAMRSGDQRRTLDAIDSDYENARMAWNWFKSERRYEDLAGCLLPAMFALPSVLGRRSELLSLIREVRNQAGADGTRDKYPVAMLALSTAETMLGYDFHRSDIYGPETVTGRKVFEEAWAILQQKPEGYSAGTWAVYAAVIHAWRDRDQGIEVLYELTEAYAAQNELWSRAVALQQLGRRLSNRSTDTDPELLRLSRTDLVAARRYLDQALTTFQMLDDAIEQSRTLGLIGYHLRSPDPEAAVGMFERAIDIMNKANLPANPSNYAALAQSYLMLGKFDEGFRLFEKMRLQYERLGNRDFLCHSMSFESMLAMRYGDLTLARTLRKRTSQILLEKDYKFPSMYSIYEEGEIERVAGHYELARQKYEQALALFDAAVGLDDHEDKGHGEAFCHRGLGDLALVEGDYKTARRHFETTLLLAQNPYEHRWLISHTFACLGRAMVGLGNYTAARAYFVKGIELPRMGEEDWRDLLMVTLSGVVELLLAEGQTEQALTMAAFVIEQASTWQEVRWRLESYLTAAQEELDREIYAAALQKGKSLTLDEALSFTGLE
ncbi:MAG: AAA family ATPase, partial [Candidatus Promineifilaceae bacterium]|nr:AAA family ATPase [Candidatus Promineifilaceae bacterium]